jgi:hypothetical protein
MYMYLFLCMVFHIVIYSISSQNCMRPKKTVLLVKVLVSSQPLFGFSKVWKDIIKS